MGDDKLAQTTSASTSLAEFTWAETDDTGAAERQTSGTRLSRHALGAWLLAVLNNSMLPFFGPRLSLGEELEIELPLPPHTRAASRSRQQLIFGLCLAYGSGSQQYPLLLVVFLFLKSSVTPEYLLQVLRVMGWLSLFLSQA